MTPRRTFGPVVLVGALAGVAAAMAGTQPWFDGAGSRSDATSGYASGLALTVDAADVPAVNALALVCLACWGVLLVSRGRFRRAVAVLGLLSALALGVAAVDAWLTVPDGLAADFEAMGISERDVSSTGWAWIGIAAAVLGVLTWGVATVLVRHWPEMGSRYDAPRPAPAAASEPDLWKVMDEGRDPTS